MVEDDWTIKRGDFKRSVSRNAGIATASRIQHIGYTSLPVNSPGY